jgi:predicted O-methyltransferase YrrM
VITLPTPVTDVFEVDGTRFQIDFDTASSAKRFTIRKPAELIEAYGRIVEDERPQRIVELGICTGGSTALLALIADPCKLVAVELDAEPIGVLTDLLDRRGLLDRVRTYYGVDQADRDRVVEILTTEFGQIPVDLVIDDASHLYQETRASFEIVFPRLRPGGAYIIEDWRAHHEYADAVARVAQERATSPSRQYPVLDNLERVLQIGEPGRQHPLSRLLVELILARASSGQVVAEITVDAHWIVVRRGPSDLDPSSFRLADLYTDHFNQLS